MARLGELVIILAIISQVITTKIILTPKDFPNQAAELHIAEGSELTIICETKDRKMVEWLYKGDEKHNMKFMEKWQKSTLTTHSFNQHLHAGYYECYEPDTEKSAAVRIFPRDVKLPKGYVSYPTDDSNHCNHGQYGIHLSGGYRDCFCFNGWSGKHCDRVDYKKRR